MNKRKVVVGFGEILWDIFDTQKKLGGAPANFAFHAAQQGAEGIVISAIGNDPLGDEILNELTGKALDIRFQRNPFPTGSVKISLNSQGIASYSFSENCAWDNIEWTDQLQEIAQKTDAVCFGSLAQRTQKTQATLFKFLNTIPASALKIFDINLRQQFYTPKTILNSLDQSHILKLNEDELPVLSQILNFPSLENFAENREYFFENIFKQFPGLNLSILTCGKQGSYICTKEGEFSFLTPDNTLKIADTVGAGDAFTANFIMATLYGKTLFEAHKIANNAANFVCTCNGAMPSLPENLKIKN